MRDDGAPPHLGEPRQRRAATSPSTVRTLVSRARRPAIPLAAVVFSALLSGACISNTSSTTGDAASPETGSGSNGDAGTGTSDASVVDAEGGGGRSLVALQPSPTGYLDGSNDVGVLGAWYAYGDGWGASGGPPGKCEAASYTSAQCSSITFPPAAVPDGGAASFPQDQPGVMCLKGKAAQVIGTPPDYSSIFGVGIGLDFNNTGGVKMTYSASAHGVIGFQFTITGVPPAPGLVRVEFAMPATDATGDSYAKTITSDGTYTVLFADLKPSFSLPVGQSQPMFDASMIESIQFHIPTVTSASIPVTNLCVSQLSAVKM
jgi:hypothetical protein